MKKIPIIAITLLVLLSTITLNQKIKISKFDIEKINIENNFLTNRKDIKKSLAIFYSRNLIFLNNQEIGEILMSNSFIESFEIKKKYPNTLIIKIFEKKPIAILIDKKKKFYLSEKIDLIEFKNLKDFSNLPYVLGDQKEFKTLYENLKKINFSLDQIARFTLYESKRWDLETKNKKTIKLPSKNYLKSLKNFLELKDKKIFTKYQLFDYRIENQLILR